MSTAMTPEKAFEMYRTLVEQNEQAMPMLAWTDREGQTTIIGVTMDFPEGWGMQQVLHAVVEQIKPQLGRPASLVFSSEGWMKTVDSQEDFDSVNTSPGQFQREVDAGGDLAEAVTITGVSWDTSWSLIAGFVRGPNGHVTWDEVHEVPALGGIPDVLRHAILTP